MKIAVIAKYTFKEVMKSRIIYLSIFLGLALTLLSYIAREFTYGVPDRVTLDVGLGLISLTGVVLGIFFGVNLVSKEVENRTLYMVLSRPISRSSYFIGRVLGMSYVLVLNLIIISSFTLVGYALLKETAFDSLIIWGLIFSLFEASIVLVLAIVFSLITNVTMSSVYTVIIYILGHSLTSTFSLGYVESRPSLKTILTVYNTFFPNFSRLNLKDFILYKVNLPNDFIISNIFYGLFYFVAITIIGLMIFKKKELV